MRLHYSLFVHAVRVVLSLGPTYLYVRHDNLFYSSTLAIHACQKNCLHYYDETLCHRSLCMCWCVGVTSRARFTNDIDIIRRLCCLFTPKILQCQRFPYGLSPASWVTFIIPSSQYCCDRNLYYTCHQNFLPPSSLPNCRTLSFVFNSVTQDKHYTAHFVISYTCSFIPCAWTIGERTISERCQHKCWVEALNPHKFISLNVLSVVANSKLSKWKVFACTLSPRSLVVDGNIVVVVCLVP